MVCWFFGFIGLALTLLERGIRVEGFVAASHLISGLVELYTSTYSRQTTARRGEPGSRQQIPWDVRKSWSKHRSSKSGHESCRAVGGTPTGFRLRSETARSKRKNKHKSIENNHGKIIANGKVS